MLDIEPEVCSVKKTEYVSSDTIINAYTFQYILINLKLNLQKDE